MPSPDQVLIITDDAGESFEILYAIHRFAEAGLRPVVAATVKKVLHGVIHDFDPDWNTYVEKPGYRIVAEAAFSDIDPSGFRAALVIGGRAPEFLRHDDTLIGLVRAFAAQGKPLFAICHGIQVLVAAGLVAGRNVTCYRNVRLEVTMAGGTWIDEQAVTDGDLVTAQTWESHADFYRQVFAVLGGGRG
jgi:protease I